MRRAPFVPLLLPLLLLSCSSREIARAPLRPEELAASLHRADSLLNVGNWESARILYDAATVGRSDSMRPLIGLGRCALAARSWDDALDIARRVRSVDPNNLYAPYFSAVARRERGAFAFREYAGGTRSIEGDWGAARRDFESLLSHDSTFEDVLYQFALLNRYEGNRDAALALAALQCTKRPDRPALGIGVYRLFEYFMATEDSSGFVRWLEGLPGALPRFYRAELARRHGALTSADSLLILLSGRPADVSPSAIHLSLARLRMTEGKRSAAEEEYWRAVEAMKTPLDAAVMFEDVKYIVSDDELFYFNSLDSASRQKEYFRSFWNFRNPSLALGANLRLREHIRRYVEAEKQYEYYGARTHYNDPDRFHELRFPVAFALNEKFNDMGLIFLRQGPPDDVVRHEGALLGSDALSDPRGPILVSGVGAKDPEKDKQLDELNQRFRDSKHEFSGTDDSFQSWLYDATAESPRMIFNFQKHNAVGNNWRLTPVPSSDEMLGELSAWDSRYHRMYWGREADRVPLTAQLKEDSREVTAYALSTERLTVEKKAPPIQIPHQVDVFRAAGGKSLVDVSFAIPEAPIFGVLPDSVSRMPVEIGFSMIDARSRHVIVERDTIMLEASRSRSGMQLELVRYVVPPDSYSVAMHVRPLAQGSIGTWRTALAVRSFSSPGLMLSSIQFLKPSLEKGALTIDGIRVVQSPFRTHVRTEQLLVYFQIYHLIPDNTGQTSYRTECRLVPPGETDMSKGTVIHSHEKAGTDEMEAEFYRIDVRGIDPGRYRLVVTVTDRKRVETVAAQRILEIRNP